MDAQKGFSLIELAISAALSLLIAACLLEVYLSNKSAYQFNQGLVRLHDNLQAASYVLRQTVRSAGFIGCAKLTPDFPIKNTLRRSALPFNAQFVLRGDVANKVGLKAKADTDTLLVQQAASQQASLISNMQSSREMLVTQKPVFKKGDIVLLADCQQGVLLTVAAVKNTKDKQVLSSSQRLPLRFARHADVARVQSTLFFIRDTGRKNRRGKEISALYARQIDGRVSELVTGIENLQIRYRLTASKQWLRASQIKDWSAVRWLQINLLANSIEEINSVQQAYRFMKQRYLAHDRLLRRTWQIIIRLRA